MVIKLRTAEERDGRFIRDAWRESYFDAHAAGALDRETYHVAYRAAIPNIIARAGGKVLVATLDVDDDEILGFAAYERGAHQHRKQRCTAPVLHYVYVKNAYRRFGVARKLLGAAELGDRFEHTFKTADFAAIARKLWPDPSAPSGTRARFDPLIVRFAPESPKEKTP